MSAGPRAADPRQAWRHGRWLSAAVIAVVGASVGIVGSWFGAWATTGVPWSHVGPALGFAVLGALLALALASAPGGMRWPPSRAVEASTGATATHAPTPPVPAPSGAAPVAAASANLRAFHALLDTIPHLAWRADARGVIVHANQAWLREFRRLRPLRVDDLIELIADDDAGEFIGAWDAAQQGGGGVRVRCRLKRPGADPRWTDLDIRPVHVDSGGRDGWVGVFTDVHDVLMKIESAQHSVAEERRLRVRAERLAARKDEFLATVSHELRSPLNAISGWSEILSREPGLNASAMRAIHIVQRNARAQSKLIGDLQQLSSVLTGTMALRPTQIDLGALGREVVGRHVASAMAKGITLVGDRIAVCPVYADAANLGVALDNLVANAIQFSPDGGRVEVTIEQVSDQVRLTVEDNGRGIALDRMATLFDSLRSLDTDPVSGLAVRRDGLGLGLAVARGLVELSDGSVEAESDGPGCGSRFTVTLPIFAPLPSVESADANVQPDQPLPDAVEILGEADHVAMDAVAGLNVIIIDGDQDARELLRVALASLGARPSVAADVHAGVGLLMAGTPDLLLCDSRLPPDMLALLALSIDTVRREQASAATSGARVSPAVIATDATHIDEGADRIGETLPCGARLRKPVSLRRLATAIAQARSVTSPAKRL